MPSEYRIAVRDDLLYARHYGPRSLAGQKRAFQRYMADPQYRRGRPEFIDLSELIVQRVDFARTRAFATRVNAQFSKDGVGTLTSIWAPDDEVFAAARMYQQSAEAGPGPGIRVHVTRHEGAALAILGDEERTVAAFLEAHDFGPPVEIE